MSGIWTYRRKVMIPELPLARMTEYNNWTDFDSSDSVSSLQKYGYRIMPDGEVRNFGAVKRSSGSPVGDEKMFSWPPGFRPRRRHFFGAPSSDFSAGRVDVMKEGDLLYELGGETYMSLDGIRFDIGGDIGALPLPFQANGWPLILSPTGSGAPVDLTVSRIVDVMTNIRISVSPYMTWYQDGSRVMVQSMYGITPLRTYEMTFSVTME